MFKLSNDLREPIVSGSKGSLFDANPKYLRFFKLPIESGTYVKLFPFKNSDDNDDKLPIALGNLLNLLFLKFNLFKEFCLIKIHKNKTLNFRLNPGFLDKFKLIPFLTKERKNKRQ